MKTLVKIALTVAIGYAVFKILASFDWKAALGIAALQKAQEEKLGQVIWDLYRGDKTEITDTAAVNALQRTVDRLATAANVTEKPIKVHYVVSDEINAFAMPGNQMVVLTGLVQFADSAAMVEGVLAHELAHITEAHVTKKLLKEAGISIVLAVIGGNNELGRQLVQLIAGSAYDRSLEKEADLKGLAFLYAAGMHTKGLANFLHKMDQKNTSQAPEILKWLSTHPESAERVAYLNAAQAQLKPQTESSVITPAEWKILKEKAKSAVEALP